MPRPRIFDEAMTPAERQQRRRERLAAEEEAEQTRRNAALKVDAIERAKAGEEMKRELHRLQYVAQELKARNAELERLNAELVKRDEARNNETTGNRDTADSHETAELERLTAELDKMTRSRAHWEKQVKGLKAKLKKAETDNQLLATRPSYAFSASSLEVDIWRTLVQLAHPDKNGNSEASIKATNWLVQHKPRGYVEEE